MLLASSPTKAGLLDCIEKFYCGTHMEITSAGQVRRRSDGKILESVEVVKKGKRYQFREKS
jgi:hypothetical protein